MSRQFAWNPSELRAIPCPDCQEPANSTVLSRPDGLSIVECVSCSLRFVSPQPTTKELSRFYETAYFGGDSDFYRGANYFEERQRCLHAGTLTGTSLLRAMDLKGLRVVEVGAADGALLAWCRKQGAESVMGIEFSEEAAAWGRANYGINILHSDINPSAIPPASCDLVIAVDLIEHLPSPRTLIDVASHWLAPGGRLAIVCPNGQAMNFWGSWWIGVQDNMEHLTYLGLNQFEKWARECGFTMETHAYEGFPLRTARYGNGKETARSQRLLMEPHKALYNAALKGLTAIAPAWARHQHSIVLRRESQTAQAPHRDRAAGTPENVDARRQSKSAGA